VYQDLSLYPDNNAHPRSPKQLAAVAIKNYGLHLPLFNSNNNSLADYFKTTKRMTLTRKCCKQMNQSHARMNNLVDASL